MLFDHDNQNNPNDPVKFGMCGFLGGAFGAAVMMEKDDKNK
jgi:hypothetical protein